MMLSRRRPRRRVFVRIFIVRSIIIMTTCCSNVSVGICSEERRSTATSGAVPRSRIDHQSGYDNNDDRTGAGDSATGGSTGDEDVLALFFGFTLLTISSKLGSFILVHALFFKYLNLSNYCNYRVVIK